MTRFSLFSFAAILPVLLAATAAASSPQSGPLSVVPEVDYQRYAGRWYEIARLPNRFQKDCTGDVSATYSVRADGRIDVTNRCLDTDGRVKEASGIARPVKGKPPSVLEVRFAPAFLSFLPMVWGDYQIIALADDYSHAVVGSPKRDYLWILARTPALDQDVYKRLVEEAKSQGFDVSRLMETRHTGR